MLARGSCVWARRATPQTQRRQRLSVTSSSKQAEDAAVQHDIGQDGVHRVWLNQPKRHNAFDANVIASLTGVFADIAARDDARAVVLGGRGKSFSAGANLEWMRQMVDYTLEENKEDSHKLFDMFNAIRNCPVPVIARVNGAAVGGGSGLVAACDMAFAVQGAKFAFTEVKLGLIPAVISPFVMSKLGQGNCSRYCLTGERFDAQRAVEVGLVQECVETEEDLDAKVDSIVRELAQAEPNAVRQCKAMLQQVSAHCYASPDFASAKEYLAAEIAKARVGEPAQIRMRKFFE